MDFEYFLNLEIFKPSKMNHTSYVIPVWNNNEITYGFSNGTKTKKPNQENWSEQEPYLNLKGNEGVLSRVNDLHLWNESIRNNVVLDAESTSIYLYPHTLESNDRNSYYGYGWAIENNDSENMFVWHNGGSPTFASSMRIYLEKGFIIIVLSNNSEEYVYSITEKLSNILLTK